MGKKQNSNKQEKRLKKEAKAAEQAEQIIADAVEAVKAKPKAADEGWEGERAAGATDEEFALGCRVRELRDQSEPWWAIAKHLELEGYGESATTGKKGAARARQAYAKAFGSHPRTFTKKTEWQKHKGETNSNIIALKEKTVRELKARVVGGKAVIKKSMSDEEVAGMLKGRRIKWILDDPEIIGGEPYEMEAAIHPTYPFYVFIDNNGDRCVEFREREPRAPIEFKLVPSRIRTVRVKKIFQVR